MTRKNSSTVKPARARPPVGLVFCEDANDAASLASLANALRADLPPIHHCKKPLVLMKDRATAEARKHNANLVKAVVAARQVLSEVRFVIAHQDCDKVEPEHVALSNMIKTQLTNAGVPNVVAVAPAWEIEAWWFQWPDAVAATHGRWNRLSRTGNHGMIVNAKETLRRDLRTKGARDYEESDSRTIAANVRTMRLVATRVGTSNSFNDFEAQIKKL